MAAVPAGALCEFSPVTSDALEFTLAAFGLSDLALHARLMSLYFSLEFFPEVPAMLARLKAAGLKMAILSNGSPDMLAAAVAHSKIAHFFYAVLSADEVGVYKPHPKVYQLAVDRLGVAPAEIAFQSSNGWDASPRPHSACALSGAIATISPRSVFPADPRS